MDVCVLLSHPLFSALSVLSTLALRYQDKEKVVHIAFRLLAVDPLNEVAFRSLVNVFTSEFDKSSVRCSLCCKVHCLNASTPLVVHSWPAAVCMCVYLFVCVSWDLSVHSAIWSPESISRSW
jgi:hypothetical protein